MVKQNPHNGTCQQTCILFFFFFTELCLLKREKSRVAGYSRHLRVMCEHKRPLLLFWIWIYIANFHVFSCQHVLCLDTIAPLIKDFISPPVFSFFSYSLYWCDNTVAVRALNGKQNRVSWCFLPSLIRLVQTLSKFQQNRILIIFLLPFYCLGYLGQTMEWA